MKAPVLVSTLLLLGALTATGQPDLKISEEEFPFGHVPQQSTISQFFWFKSVGSETLVVKDVKTGCSCVMVPLESDSIPPGDSMLVGFYWDTQRKLGNIQRKPYIFTNRP